MERKLATIQRIDKIKPIPNADKIVVASILGWKAVIYKDQFKDGDSIVYFEIDSFLPVKPEFEFLRENCYKKFEDGREGIVIRPLQEAMDMGMSIAGFGNNGRLSFKVINPEYLLVRDS